MLPIMKTMFQVGINGCVLAPPEKRFPVHAIRFASVIIALATCLSTVLAQTQPKTPPYPTVPSGLQRGGTALAGGPMPYFRDRENMAEVVSATFLGGKGTEYLCGGGFQRDGTVVLAGNVMGGLFDLGMKASVLGNDTAAPPVGEYERAGGHNQEPAKRPSWRNPAATGFIVHCSKDLRGITSVTRLPWLAGAITSLVVGDDDAIYIAGRATPEIAKLGGPQEALPKNPDATRKGGYCEFTFVARLSPDARTIQWLRTLKGFSDAPRLIKTKNGISFLAQDIRIFTPGGEQKSVAVIAGGVRENASLSPLDGTIVCGSEHHWPTGRQPYRCPILNTYTPEGKLQYQFYDWGGPYVVVDDLFLVSDTAVRMVSHDRDGNVMIMVWSDGGNSVAYRQPNDIRTWGVGRGLGLTAAGAHATSFSYLLKLEPKNYQIIGSTLWCSNHNGRGNGIWIDTLGQIDDGSFAFTGNSAWGMHQTSNKLANGEPAGPYVAVLTKDLTGARFSSAVPGAGMAEVANDSRWAIGSGTVDGKPKVLFLGSAAKEDNIYGLVTATPTVNALQGQFAGGVCDGYVIMLDLSKTAAPDAKAEILPLKPTPLSINQYAVPKNRKPGKKDIVPIEGEVFHFRPDYPRWTTVDAEIRDPSGNFWPNFCYGKAVSGQITWIGGQPQGSFEVTCTKWCQPAGDQNRRVLGPMISEQPKFALRITALSPPKTKDVTVTDSRDRQETRLLTYSDAEGELEIADRVVKIRPQCVFRVGLVLESTIRKTQIQAFCTIKGKDLGLTGERANLDIDIRFGMQCHAGAPPPAPRREE